MLSHLPAPEDLPTGPIAPVTSDELLADVAEGRQFPEGFFAFAKHWRFKNRENGRILTFADPWPGQRIFMQLMIEIQRLAINRADWLGIFALKAGKLGFTEIECCWDGYVAWAARASCRVHLFSKEEQAAKDMLALVRFGLKMLEPSFGVRFLDSSSREIEADRAGVKEFRFTVLRSDGSRDYGDERRILAYATGKFPAINESCSHAHVDEWCHMENPKDAWGAIETTISPEGSAHIVSRGAGEHEYVENTWKAAVQSTSTREAGGSLAGASKLSGYFAPYSARPGRDELWKREQAATLPTLAALAHFAAETPEDAFLGDQDNDFVPIEIWDACAELMCCAAGHYRGGDPPNGWQPQTCESCAASEASGVLYSYLATHPLLPGDPTKAVLGADAATSHDTFGIVLTTRHPLRPKDPAIRLRRLWRPDDFEDGQIDYATVQSWIRTICRGGCALGHPYTDPEWRGGRKCKKRKGQTWEPGECPECAAIERGERAITPRFNVVQLSYDPYQLEEMMQALRRDGVTWCKSFAQGLERLKADRTLYDVIMGNRIGHTGDELLRQHIQNAKSKTQKDDDSKLRIIKKAEHRKIDLAVAASMSVEECLRLNL